jgi:hypothetical protein
MLAIMLPSHGGNDTVGATWSRWDVDAVSCWQRCYRGDLAVARYRCRVMLATVLPSHAGDSAAGVTWPWHDVDAESCWRYYCRVMLAMALPGRLGHGAL